MYAPVHHSDTESVTVFDFECLAAVLRVWHALRCIRLKCLAGVKPHCCVCAHLAVPISWVRTREQSMRMRIHNTARHVQVFGYVTRQYSAAGRCILVTIY